MGAVKPCSIDGCEKRAESRGWCNTHYERWRRNGDPGAAGDARKRPIVDCSIEGCTGTAAARGWCEKHYARWRVHGDPEFTLRPTYGEGRHTADNGYVRVWCPGHPEAHADGYAYEHRKMWHDTHGPIPAGFQVHHRNEQRDDNRLDNFELKRAGVHQREHAEERGHVTNQYGTWPLRAAS